MMLMVNMWKDCLKICYHAINCVVDDETLEVSSQCIQTSQIVLGNLDILSRFLCKWMHKVSPIRMLVIYEMDVILILQVICSAGECCHAYGAIIMLVMFGNNILFSLTVSFHD